MSTSSNRTNTLNVKIPNIPGLTMTAAGNRDGPHFTLTLDLTQASMNSEELEPTRTTMYCQGTCEVFGQGTRKLDREGDWEEVAEILKELFIPKIRELLNSSPPGASDETRMALKELSGSTSTRLLTYFSDLMGKPFPTTKSTVIDVPPSMRRIGPIEDKHRKHRTINGTWTGVKDSSCGAWSWELANARVPTGTRGFREGK